MELTKPWTFERAVRSQSKVKSSTEAVYCPGILSRKPLPKVSWKINTSLLFHSQYFVQFCIPIQTIKLLKPFLLNLRNLKTKDVFVHTDSDIRDFCLKEDKSNLSKRMLNKSSEENCRLVAWVPLQTVRAWGPFLERPGNFTGPKANFEIETCWIVAQFLSHKPANFASLTERFIISFSKLLKLWSWMQTCKHKIGFQARKVIGTFEKRAPGARFLKVPIINGPCKLSPFTLKIEVSLVLHLTW